MSFFGKNASFAAENQFPVAPTGNYKCELVSVDSVDRPSYDNHDVMEKNFVWRWETTEFGDDSGRPFRFTFYTKVSYGFDGSKLTKLLDGMLGKRLTREQFAGLDLADLLATPWRVNVTKSVSQRGKDVNIVQSVAPWQEVKTRKPLRKSDDLSDVSDPFAE